MDVEDRYSSTQPQLGFVDDEATGEMKTEKIELPMRLYFGNGPRIHAQLCIECGVVDKKCADCGEVGQLTCFSSSFRKWALKRVTREEMSQQCNRCKLYGHKGPSCDLPVISRRLEDIPAPRKRRAVHCGLCGEAGHNRRTCSKVGRG